MAKKKIDFMTKQVVIERSDLCTVSEFAIRFRIPRLKVYDLIHAGKLPGEVISGVFYPNIENQALIEDVIADNYTSGRGQWPRKYNPVHKCDESDSDFEKAYQESMK